MAEQEEFDPYRKWLGIPAAEQPPTHYRLLGLVTFENDPDVISNAADRCMAHVRTFQTGLRSEVSQKILTELSIARSCLLDPQRRKDYDQQLNRQRAAAAPPPSAPVTPMAVSPMAPVPVAMPVSAASSTAVADRGTDLSMVSRSSSTSVRQRVRRKSSPIPMLVTVAAVVLATFIAVLMLNKKPEPVPTPSNATTQPAKQPVKTIVIPRDPSKTAPPREPGSTTHGGAPVVEVRPSNTIDYGRDREAPTSAQEALDTAWTQMGRMNLQRARRLLEYATGLNPTSEQRERHDHLSKLWEYLDNYHRALLTGSRKLEPGEKFTMSLGERQVTATFVESDREKEQTLVFEMDGRRTSYRLDALPTEWSVKIARTMLDEQSPAARLALATFLGVANNGNREQARQMWEELIREGVVQVSLAAELKLPLSPDLMAKKPEPEKPKTPESMPEKKPETTGKTGQPVPEGEALLAAKKQFRDSYRDRLTKAKAAAEKAELAQELYTAAATTPEPGLKYVLYTEAIGLAVELSNAAAFLPMIDELTEKFAVDALVVKTGYLGDASSGASSVEQGAALYLAASEVYYQAKQLKRYDVAEKIARTAAKCALRAQDRDASARAELEARKMQTLHQLTIAGQEAQAKLKENAEDPAASAAAGRLECFVNGNWPAGLALLAKGDDKPLAELATADLAAPTDPVERGALAERWLQTSRQQKDGAKAAPLTRARHWYQQALEGATGAAKAAYEKSVQEIDEQLKAGA